MRRSSDGRPVRLYAQASEGVRHAGGGSVAELASGSGEQESEPAAGRTEEAAAAWLHKPAAVGLRRRRRD
jgi:hypothetical protein